MASFLGITLPLILLVVLIALPYVFKGWKNKRPRAMGKLMKMKLVGAVAWFLIVFLVAGAPFGVLYVETHESPTLGCNSCHNLSMGNRMGLPPTAFKDRKVIPLLDDNRWMVEHWFYPQVAW
jgi:hypothetical protein